MAYKQLKPNTFKNKTSTNPNSRSNDKSLKKRVLFSSEDVERMAVESSRARLMLQLVSKTEDSPRAFGSYFHAPKKNNDAPYGITSHTLSIPIPKRRVLWTYPTLLQNFRWSPSIETNSIDSLINSDGSKSVDTCQCSECKRNCQAKLKDQMKEMSIKDNIMRFSDNSTMTLKMHDIGCGQNTSILPTPSTSEATISMSDVVVRDSSKFQSTPTCVLPIPILKKTDTINCQNFECRNKRRVTVNLDDDVNNRLTDYDDLIRSFPVAEKQNKTTNCSNNSNPNNFETERKTLYNEGISNKFTSNILDSLSSKTMFSKQKSTEVLSKESSRASLISKCTVENCGYIPYAHRNHSKYHHDCKSTSSKPHKWRLEDDINHMVASQITQKNPYTYKTLRCDRNHIIRLPKKVLASEKDIECFIDKRPYRKRISTSVIKTR